MRWSLMGQKARNSQQAMEQWMRPQTEVPGSAEVPSQVARWLPMLLPAPQAELAQRAEASTRAEPELSQLEQWRGEQSRDRPVAGSQWREMARAQRCLHPDVGEERYAAVPPKLVLKSQRKLVSMLPGQRVQKARSLVGVLAQPH